MKKPLAIYGAGGLGKEVLSLVASLQEWEVIGFYDDGMSKGSPVRDGLTVLGGLADLQQTKNTIHVVLAIGSPEKKAHLAGALDAIDKIRFPSLVHPSVIIQDPSRVTLGRGSMLCAGSILTTDIVLEEHVLINLNVTVGHDVNIGKCSSVMPGVNIAGQVKIGDGVLVGAGANLINNVVIGDRCRIGAGAVVIRALPPRVTAVGVPAVVIKPR